MNTDGHTIDGYKHPIFCGDLKEAVTLFDRNVLTIDLNDKGAGLWDKDMTGRYMMHVRCSQTTGNIS